VIINKLGFLQALGVTVYCSLIGLVLWQGSNIFPKVNAYFGPVMFLILFSTSALVCGLMVFYKPYQLFFAGKKKEAINAVVSTSVWLFLFLLIFFALMILFK
jgi:hypothetical protein